MRIGYVRVSTHHQNTERQERQLKSSDVDMMFVDYMSGKNTNRPQFQKMMDYVREGDVVVVESLSRLTRGNSSDIIRILEELQEKGVRLECLKENIDDGTIMGRMFLEFAAIIYEAERKNMLERQREGIAIAKELGKYKGRKPKDIEGLQEMYKMNKSKRMTATEICRNLGISRATWYRRVKEIEKNEKAEIEKKKH